MIKVQEILDSTGARLVRGSPDRLCRGVSTDTRALERDNLFLALSGPNFDGNRFAREACDKGAGALVLSGGGDVALDGLPGDLPVCVHDAPVRALGDLAAWHRARLSIPVIGVTGSSGKTTTKGILAQLLAAHRRTVASPSSFNNEIGVPLTVLMADDETEVLVVEIGTNAPGEIASLCRVAKPTVGVITNVGESHLEGLGSIEGVAREKSDLFASLPADGVAVMNADSRFTDVQRAATAARVTTFSVEGDGELDATEPLFHAGGTTFRLCGREVTSPLLGLHNISNLLAALAACMAVGLTLDELLPVVSRLEGGRRRMERRQLGPITVFDDSYNANPDSARAAVRVLAGLHGAGRRVLVLGDMLELGPSAPELHHRIGREAAENGIDLVLLVGELVEATAAGALEAGLPPDRVLHFGTGDDVFDRIVRLIGAGDIVLVKGSRRTGLDQLVEELAIQFGEEGR